MDGPPDRDRVEDDYGGSTEEAGLLPLALSIISMIVPAQVAADSTASRQDTSVFSFKADGTSFVILLVSCIPRRSISKLFEPATSCAEVVSPNAWWSLNVVLVAESTRLAA